MTVGHMGQCGTVWDSVGQCGALWDSVWESVGLCHEKVDSGDN